MLCDGLEERLVKIGQPRQGSWMKRAYVVQARRIKAADSASANEEDVYRPVPSWSACFLYQKGGKSRCGHTLPDQPNSSSILGLSSGLEGGGLIGG